MESKRTATTYFIPPGKFLLMENALGNPDLIQSSVSSDCRVTIVDKANFPLDELEQWPTFRLVSSDIKLKLGSGSYYIYIVVPTPDNDESTSAFISYHTLLVDRDGYQVLQTTDEEGNPKLERGDLLGKPGFKYYQCGTVSARGGNSSAVTTPSGKGRLIEMDLGVTPSPSTLPGDLNDFDKMFQIDKVDESNPKSWLLTILLLVKQMAVRVLRVTDRIIFGEEGGNEKPVTDVKRTVDSDNEFLLDENGNPILDEEGNQVMDPMFVPVGDETIPTTAWVVKQTDGKYLSKIQDDTAKGNITFEKNIGSPDFVKGNLMGAGWSIYKDANGNTVVETDTIIARKGINASELIINQETFQKGSTIYVKGGCTITKVEEIDGVYRCYYDNEGGKRFSGFVVGDQARCQRYDSSYGLKIKYYWRLVVGVADDYVDLLITDFDGDGVPEAGDDIAQLGNRTDNTRQSAIVISPDNGGSVVVWAGIGDGEYPYSLSEKNMCGMGVNAKTGRAYIYGYGDMFFGDRNNSSFVKFDIENGVEVKGKLSVGTKLSDGRILEDTLKSLSPEGYDELVVNVGKLSGKVDEFGTDLESVKQQTDRQFTIWFFNYEPTLYNEPASNWDTPELKAEHDQDMFYYRDAGKAWRFEKGEWKSITDQDTIRALELIAATRKEVDDMSYLTKALKDASPTVIENGLVMSSVVAVQNQDGEVEAFINGSEFAKDEDHGKLLMAGGVPEDGGTLEERSKKALTRIYEDGRIVSKSAEIEGQFNVGKMMYRTLISRGGNLEGYSMAIAVEDGLTPAAGEDTGDEEEGDYRLFVLPGISDGSFTEVRVVWFKKANVQTSYAVNAGGKSIINYKENDVYVTKDILYIEPDVFYRFFAVNGNWYVSTEPILNQ